MPVDSSQSVSMPWIFLGIGVALMIVSIVLTYYYNRAKKALDELWAVDTYSAVELARMVKGQFDATVEVEGQVSCDVPVIAPATGIPCCWVKTTVAREDRRTREVTERDADGNTHTRTETYYEWVTDYDETLTAQFKVTDSTGTTVVEPTRAEIDTQVTRSEIIYDRETWFAGSVGYSDTGKYRVHESAFLPEGYAFVLGRASEHSGGALIHAPEQGYMDPKARFFVISRKTEQELVASYIRSKSLYFWFAIVTFLGAVTCLLLFFGVF